MANYTRGSLRRIKSGSWDEGEIIGALEAASNAAERAGDTLRGIRRFVQRSEPQRATVDLNELVRSVLQLAELEFEENWVRVTVTLGEELPPVAVDNIQIQQVVLNLTRNALEALSEFDHLERALTFRTGMNGSQEVEVSVSNTGTLTAEDTVEKMIEPFFSTTPSGYGNGPSH